MTAEAPGAAPQPRVYRPRMPILWWLRRRSYLTFVLRELSSAFVAWSVVFILLAARAIGQGDAEYRRFLDWSATWWVLALNVLTLAFVLFHAVTWFNLAPSAIVVKLRGRRVPPAGVAAAHFVAWALVSAFVAWLTLG